MQKVKMVDFNFYGSEKGGLYWLVDYWEVLACQDLKAKKNKDDYFLKKSYVAAHPQTPAINPNK